MSRLDGKVALVAGGASGIGRAAAERLAIEGAAVAVLDIDERKAQATAEAIQAAGGTALAVYGDLADEDTIRRAVETTCARLGGIDCLLNSGFLRAHQHEDGNVVDTRQEVWDRIIDVNLMGFVRTCRQVIPRMIERGGGAIVNMTTPSERGSAPRLVAYLASKSAITALTRNTAVAFGPQGIRANAVAPGMTATENTLAGNDPIYVDTWASVSPQRRLGQPSEVAAVIAFLLSDDASMISGEVVYVDGGRGIAS